MAITGNQAAIGFGTLNFTAEYMELGEIDQEGGAIDTSHLLSVGEATKIPQDLFEPGEMLARFIFDPSVAPPVVHQVDDITITFPLQTMGNAPATLVGSGFITRRQFPNQQNNQLNEGEFTWQFDGISGPTFTPETTP